jgi:4-hydroxy-tetrahydrodipicolinate reductase
MGSTVASAVSGADDMTLVASVDPQGPSTSLDALVDAEAQVAVDFTVPSAALDNALWCADHGVHCVIGTTGLGEEAVERLAAAFPPSGSLGCIVAPNFAIGAVLMMHFAALAAPWFETAEIIELHHDAKIDAPSGTALLTAARMEEASGSWAPDPTRTEAVPGARGGLAPGGVRIHSVRLRGLVAHQEVILGTTGQTLTIRHDSMDRQSFMPGVLLAVRSVGAAPGRPGLTVGLEALLGI